MGGFGKQLLLCVGLLASPPCLWIRYVPGADQVLGTGAWTGRRRGFRR